jgi:hypothetical protein
MGIWDLAIPRLRFFQPRLQSHHSPQHQKLTAEASTQPTPGYVDTQKQTLTSGKRFIQRLRNQPGRVSA